MSNVHKNFPRFSFFPSWHTRDLCWSLLALRSVDWDHKSKYLMCIHLICIYLMMVPWKGLHIIESDRMGFLSTAALTHRISPKLSTGLESCKSCELALRVSTASLFWPGLKQLDKTSVSPLPTRALHDKSWMQLLIAKLPFAMLPTCPSTRSVKFHCSSSLVSGWRLFLMLVDSFLLHHMAEASKHPTQKSF